ncbi:MAG: hypothetical protein ACE5FV_02565 [Woeseia sp.]
MHETKEISFKNDYDDAQEEPDNSRRAENRQANGSLDVDGWQQYRRWISKAPVPKQRRSGIDPSLYTWKGYRSWAEQVKRNWSDD